MPPAQPQSLADPLADDSKALMAAGCWLLAAGHPADAQAPKAGYTSSEG